MRTWKELAQDALDVQDACNLSGVVHSFSKIVSEVRGLLEAEGQLSTLTVNFHPVCRLYADKIASLTGTQSLGNESVHHAYKWAYDQIGQKS